MGCHTSDVMLIQKLRRTVLLQESVLLLLLLLRLPPLLHSASLFLHHYAIPQSSFGEAVHVDAFL